MSTLLNGVAEAQPSNARAEVPTFLMACGTGAAGAVHALALSPYVAALGDWAPSGLQSLAVLVLLWLLHKAASPRQGAWLAWAYGTLWVSGATLWLYVSLHRYGGLPSWLAIGSVALLCSALSVYMAALGWAWVRWRTASVLANALLFAALWCLAEMARAQVLTGFPWGASGYGLIASPFVKLAPWLGVYGLGAVWAFVCAALASSLVPRHGRARSWLGLALAVALTVALALSRPAAFTQPVGERLQVSLLQGNVPQDQKFDAQMQVPMLIWHARQLIQAPGQLVLAPETAIPLLPSQLPEGYWDQIRDAFRGDRHGLLGLPLGDFDQGYTNSVAGLSAKTLGSPDGFYRYDKHHLVPFGEFIPNGFRWFVRLMNMPLGDFSRGPLAAPSFAVRDQRVAPTICYEDLFGEDIAARFVDASQAPTILANVSNLAWFGESVAIFQHLQVARMRSMEFQLPTLRATNTGATVVIDHAGRVTHALPNNTRGSLQADVQGYQGVTPFAAWAGHAGLWPLWGLCAGIVLLVRWRQRHSLESGASARP